MAITNKICMMAPALYAKNPIAQKIIKITAMVYNKLLMILVFKDY